MNSNVTFNGQKTILTFKEIKLHVDSHGSFSGSINAGNTMFLFNNVQYNKKIVGRSDQLSQALKEKITQDNVLCAHAELSALVNATHYKNHHLHAEPLANRKTVLYETADVIRYMMATLNTWGITSSEFENAFEKKDNYLMVIYKTLDHICLTQ